MSQIEPRPKVNFIFDIIVTRLHMSKDKIDEPNNVVVNVKFNKIGINITASRINVTEFQAGRRTEFTIAPGMLRANLETSGMPLTVRYNGSTLGNALITFPQSFIDHIEVGMSDLLHAETCAIARRGVEVGNVELLCILFIKCDEQEIEIEACNQSCAKLANAMNPADIMFVVGTPQPCAMPCEPCLDELQPEEGDDRLKLDLARYPSMNKRVMEPPAEICGMDECCQLKALTEKYGELIDSVIKKVSQLPSPMPDDDFVFTDWSGKQIAYKNKVMDDTISVPVGDMEDEGGIRPIRFCPICLNPMTWLPKYAPCPKCCAKAVPQIEEKSEEMPTADQIIEEFLKVPLKSVEDFCKDPCDKSKDEDTKGNIENNESKENNGSKGINGSKVKSRTCTCTFDKMCAHCRIRNLCSNVFNPAHVSRSTCFKPTPQSNEDFCIIAEPNIMQPDECRPNLEQVFFELQDLYDKRDANKTAELQKRCTQSLFRFGLKPDDNSLKLANKSSSGALLKASGSPTFMNRVPQGPKLGHKACLKRQGIVSRRHGWAWKSSKEARKYGWRPGAICRCAGTIMRFFLNYSPENNAFNTCRRAAEKERRKQLPILNVCKRNGDIFITLRAVNNPHVIMEPIVFKVVKSDLAVALRDIKRKLKERGFCKCTCHNSVMMCVCRNYMEKKHLEHALRKECKLRGMQNCVEHLVLTDTSESEMEFNLDVTPPAGAIKPQLSVKPRTVSICTQTIKKDQTVSHEYPIKLDYYWRAYDCAAGDRYTGTAFGALGEDVFEDGLFGHRGGGPHGPSATPGGKAKTKGIWGARPGGPMRGGGRVVPRGIGGGAGGGPGGKSFPGAKKKPAVPSVPIPVRMPKRYIEGLKQAAQAEKDAIKKEIEKKKKGVDTMKYLMGKGTVATPWNPNDPKPEVKNKTGPVN